MQSTHTATLADGRTITILPAVIGEGSMKEAYFTADRQSVVCFYKDHAAGADPLRRRRLEAILRERNITVPRSQGGAARTVQEADEARAWYCWPTGIVIVPRLGIVTPTYPSQFFFSSGPDFIRGKEKNGMRFIGQKNRALLARFAPAELGDWRGHLAMCLQMARAVARMHDAGLVHSDLSPNNVLVDPTRGACLVTDIEALVVEGLYPPDVLGTKGYIAPEVLTTMHLARSDPGRRFPSVSTDRYALAVLIYQYLLHRHPLDGRKVPTGNTGEEQEVNSLGAQALFCEHPTDASNRPETTPYVPCAALGPSLEQLFLRAFVDGLHSPDRRPTALEWVAALRATWDLLRPCHNTANWHRWFVGQGPPDMPCPFCAVGTAM
jgi:hypothetical protein